MKKARAAMILGTTLSTLTLSLAGGSAAHATAAGHWWNDSPSVNECLAAAQDTQGPTIMWSCTSEPGQQWGVFPLLTSSVFQIANNNGDCLEVPRGEEDINGAWVGQNAFCGGDGGADSWEKVPLGNGFSEIVNAVTGKCLSVANGSLSSGAHVIQWTCQQTPDQEWQGVGL